MANQSIPQRGVYAIECVDGRRYIGGSVNIPHRWASHRFDLKRGGHRNSRLQSAWDDLGEASFSFVVLEIVASGDLREAEQRWLDALGEARVFNIYTTAGSPRGTTFSAEVRARNAIAQTGLRVGSRNPNAKLTESDVEAIRMLADGGLLQREIAARYGITRENVGKIVRRQGWA